MKKQKLMLGDNITSLKKLPNNSIDSVVTDPPYGLSFMNKKWDYDVPSVEFWKEVYRVLKPGGHILSFGGTRTYHRMVVNIEDAGFEIRDQIQWLYGSGFPKSLNVGKAVDKLEGNEREVVGERDLLGPALHEGGMRPDGKSSIDITKGQSEWEGWGSALKPANEPICLARKPLSEKSIAENVLKWRTGGLNIDECRIPVNIENEGSNGKRINKSYIGSSAIFGNCDDYTTFSGYDDGRFPANIMLDETAAEMLDEQSGLLKSGDFNRKSSNLQTIQPGGWKTSNRTKKEWKSSSGGASRFFYVAKVSKAERNMGLDDFEELNINYTPGFNSRDENGNIIKSDGSIMNPIKRKNNHPTVKPVNLMSYICKLITPPNGIILDPFMGSGSTGIAALLNDFRFVGMEMDVDYFNVAQARINDYESYRKFLKK